MYVCAFIFNSSMIISIYVSLPVYVSASACINMYLKNGQIRASFADKKDHIKEYICNSFPLRHCWKSLPQLSGRSHAAMLNFAGRNSRKLKHTLCHWAHRPQWHALYNPALWCCPTVLESARHTRGVQLLASFAYLGEIEPSRSVLLTWKLSRLTAFVSALAFLRSQIFRLSGWQMC